MGKIQLDFEFDRKWESLEEITIHTVHTCGKPLSHLAGELDLSPAGLSKRLNLHPDQNDPRFNLGTFERILERTKDYRPIFYLVEKFLQKDEEKIMAEFREFRRKIPELKKFIALMEK